VVQLLEEFGALERVEGFVSSFGRAFYGVGVRVGDERVVLRKLEGKGRKVDERWVLGEESVVPFWAGKQLKWEIVEDTTV